MKLIISSLSEMKRFSGKVTHILSVVDPDDGPNIPSLGVPTGRRLVLLCDDVESRLEALQRERMMPGNRCIAPTETMVERALAFAKVLPDDARLLIHCGQGISRSTAMAFAIMCQASPALAEKEVFQKVLELRPQASPNALIVKYADSLLARRGRMAEAIRNIR